MFFGLEEWAELPSTEMEKARSGTCGLWEESQKYCFEHVKFEMGFRRLSGNVKQARRLYGSGVQGSLGDTNLGVVDIGSYLKG